MFLSVANGWPAFNSLAYISLSELPSAIILDPRYMNSATSSMFYPCSFIGSFVLLFILMCLVFAMLVLSPILCAIVESASVFDCMSERRWDVRQMSSAKSRSSSWVVSIHLIPLLSSLSTFRVIQSMLSTNRNGERMQPCFTPYVVTAEFPFPEACLLFPDLLLQCLGQSFLDNFAKDFACE